MNGKENLKRAKLFLKMAEYDFTLIKIIKVAKAIFAAALLINSTAFGVMLLSGMKKLKA